MGYCATVKASIDAAARANSSNDDDDDDAEYSYFGELPNPDPEDLSPRDVCRDFTSLFVGSRKSQAEYPKARKIKIFYEALTVAKMDILGDMWRRGRATRLVAAAGTEYYLLAAQRNSIP